MFLGFAVADAEDFSVAASLAAIAAFLLGAAVGGRLGGLLGAHPAMRSEALPDVPAMVEFLPSYEASLVTGLRAPKSTPAEIIDRINRETNNAFADPKMKAQIKDDVISNGCSNGGALNERRSSDNSSVKGSIDSANNCLD